MSNTTLSPEQATELRNDWIRAIAELAQEVKTWAEAQGWTVETSACEVNEASIGSYRVPRLEISTPRGSAILEPIARDVAGAAGRVDLYAYPTLYRVMLLRRPGGNWVIRTDSGLIWPQPWGEASFAALVEELIGAS